MTDPKDAADMTDMGGQLPHGAHTDFSEGMTYGDYLCLDSILSAQKPVSAQHDEYLFIIIHQATELWMKLVLHELRAAIAAIARDDLRPAFKMLARVGRIQSQLIQSWDVLSTLTPADYLTFRDRLGQSSGFQSSQYRQIEFLFGNKNAAMLEPHRDRPDDYRILQETLESPTRRGIPMLLCAKDALPTISQGDTASARSGGRTRKITVAPSSTVRSPQRAAISPLVSAPTRAPARTVVTRTCCPIVDKP